MKRLLVLSLIIFSFNIMAKCPNVADSQLNTDQLIVKKLLDSAYLYKSEGQNSNNLTAFTTELKKDYTAAAEFLNEGEISAFILEQDNDDNVCQNQEFPSSESFKTLIADKIIDTYYGCGCEH